MPSLPIPQTKFMPFSAFRDAQRGLPKWATESETAPREPGLLPFDSPLAFSDDCPLTDLDRDRVIDAAQEAVCAALAADRELCALRRDRLNGLCLHRPLAALAAVREIEQILALDIIGRHMTTCHKRRQLLRDLQSLLDALRDIAG